MSVAVRLAGFGALLLAVFGAALAVGGALGPEPRERSADPHAGDPAATAKPAARGHAAAADGRASDASAGEMHPVRGLAVAEAGLRLVVPQPERPPGRSLALSFRIADAKGRTVRSFDVAHSKRMHVIVVRRDLSGFQHLHPTQASDGSWRLPLRLDEPGSYRLFADFSRRGRPHTLAADLRVDGAADLLGLPAPRTTAVSDGGYDVRLDAGRPRAGRPAELRFAVTRGGGSVHVEPYLGAKGHLVALREGDLGFLHVHPAENGHGADGTARGGHDDSVGFDATFPTAGRYRLFLQFRHEGRVRTASFTQEVR